MSFGTEVDPHLYASAQPTAAQVMQLCELGFTRIIDLRPRSEDHGFDEAKAAAAAGLEYLILPIATEADLTPTAVHELDGWLGATTPQKTLVHCASSNRVGAMLALRAAWHQGLSVEQALQVGRLAGLKSLEPAVIRALQQRSA